MPKKVPDGIGPCYYTSTWITKPTGVLMGCRGSQGEEVTPPPCLRRWTTIGRLLPSFQGYTVLPVWKVTQPEAEPGVCRIYYKNEATRGNWIGQLLVVLETTSVIRHYKGF